MTSERVQDTVYTTANAKTTTMTTNDTDLAATAATAPVDAGNGTLETLLCAVARLKGIGDDAIANAINVPLSSVSAYFSGRNVGFREDVRQQLAAFLGVDLVTSRLSDDRVHIFDLSRLPVLMGRDHFDSLMGAMGILLREARAAIVEISGRGGIRSVSGQRVRVVQNKHSRAVFLSGRCAGFRAEFDPVRLTQCQWAGADKSKSVIKVSDHILAGRILCGDLTISEFDQIFRGPGATSWADVEMAARVNGVICEEIVEWIETVGSARALQRLRTQETPAERWGRVSGEVVEQAAPAPATPHLQAVNYG